jgi:hypothetical protein
MDDTNKDESTSQAGSQAWSSPRKDIQSKQQRQRVNPKAIGTKAIKSSS